MILNMTGGGSARKPMSTIIVTAPSGSRVTAALQGGETREVAEADGVWTFPDCDIGRWTITATRGVAEKVDTKIDIQEEGQLFRYEVQLDYLLKATDFDWASYGVLGADYELVKDDDTPLDPSEYDTAVNWKARLLTTNTNGLAPLRSVVVDVFCVGGAGGGCGGQRGNDWYGGGGGGGYTKTQKNVTLERGESYPVNIGSGGFGGEGNKSGGDGGTTSAFGVVASGGFGSIYKDANVNGGNGGSGGGGAFASSVPSSNSAPGTDGHDGQKGANNAYGGKGQRSTPGVNGETGTTGEFGDETARKYSSGGWGKNRTEAPVENTGDGGHGGSAGGGAGTKGASGIVIIRNAREVE